MSYIPHQSPWMPWHGNVSALQDLCEGNPRVNNEFHSKSVSNVELLCFRFCQLERAFEQTVKLLLVIWYTMTLMWYHCNVALTHWGRVTHICIGNLIIIGSDNGLSPGRREAIIWTNDGILLIGLLGTYVSEIVIGIQIFSFKKMHLKMASAKWLPFCLGLKVLNRMIEYIIHNGTIAPINQCYAVTSSSIIISFAHSSPL